MKGRKLYIVTDNLKPSEKVTQVSSFTGKQANN